MIEATIAKGCVINRYWIYVSVKPRQKHIKKTIWQKRLKVLCHDNVEIYK